MARKNFQNAKDTAELAALFDELKERGFSDGHISQLREAAEDGHGSLPCFLEMLNHADNATEEF